MENEVEVLDGEVVQEVGEACKSTKWPIIGGIAVAIAIPVIFLRKKIRAKVEKRMVKKLTKKGYAIYGPTTLKEEEIPTTQLPDLE